jgi:ElaB/YqjD/DUF883 family membrane-anchored ribosome-binding protein
MSTQADAIERDNGQAAGAEPTSLLQGAADAAGDAAARLRDAAQAAGREAKDAASGLAAEANQNVKGLLNDQLAAGVGVADHLAEAVRAAADTLHPNAPRLAGIVRTAAGTIDDFSGTMRGRSVEDVLQTASDFTRRQPAAAFGAAALAGFFLFRVLRADNSGRASGGPTRTGEPRHGT